MTGNDTSSGTIRIDDCGEHIECTQKPSTGFTGSNGLESSHPMAGHRECSDDIIELIGKISSGAICDPKVDGTDSEGMIDDYDLVDRILGSFTDMVSSKVSGRILSDIRSEIMLEIRSELLSKTVTELFSKILPELVRDLTPEISGCVSKNIMESIKSDSSRIASDIAAEVMDELEYTLEEPDPDNRIARFMNDLVKDAIRDTMESDICNTVRDAVDVSLGKNMIGAMEEAMFIVLGDTLESVEHTLADLDDDLTDFTDKAVLLAEAMRDLCDRMGSVAGDDMGDDADLDIIPIEGFLDDDGLEDDGFDDDYSDENDSDEDDPDEMVNRPFHRNHPTAKRSASTVHSSRRR